MSKVLKNNIFTWLLGLLLLANAVTLVFFWIGKPPQEMLKDSPKDFLTAALNFDERQQDQFAVLRKEHRAKTESLREKIKAAKDDMFDLIKLPGVSDSVKQVAARRVSVLTEELDLNTLDHFQKVRALCNERQQEKFDTIIHQLTRMMGNQRPGRPGGPAGPGRQREEQGPPGYDGQGPPPGEGHGSPRDGDGPPPGRR
jgi:hypothetical protein